MKNIVLLGALFFLFSCNTDIKNEPNVYYTCSMHLQIHEKEMGKCPICFMDLTKMIENPKYKKQIKLSESQIKLANIQIDSARISDIGEEIQLHARLTVNENNLQNISSRFAGRIEFLFFKNIGEYIERNTPLFEIYSEEILATEKEYVTAMEHLSNRTNPEEYERIAESAKNKLLLWGISEKQISALKTKQDIKRTNTIYSPVEGYIQEVNIKQGDYIMEGKILFQLADLSSLWLEGQAFANEMQHLKVDKEVSYQVSAFPNEWNKGKISFVSPELQADSKVNLVRVEIKNPEHKYQAGMLAYIHVMTQTKKGIILPINAVLQQSDGNRVWVELEDGIFDERKVQLGMQTASAVEVVSGIKLNDRVVVSGAYLLQSEKILKDNE